MIERKVAIITGSGTGVGAATALLLSKQGYNVLINYSRSETEAQASQADCQAVGADTLLMQGDVAQDADCKALTQAAFDKWGRIDALVNNAGISTFTGAANWDVLDMDTFSRIYAVNTVGAFQMVRACTPHLKMQKGSVVNVSSIAGSLGIGSSVPYIASKGALNSLTLYLARALAPDIRVNAVCPGLITSRWFVDGLGQDGFEKVKAMAEWRLEQRRQSAILGNGNWWLLMHQGIPVASCGLFFDQDCLKARFREVTTHPKWRGRGFATRLCGMLAQNFLTQGQVQELIIVSEPNSIADSIYSKLGFKAVSYQIALITDPRSSQID